MTEYNHVERFYLEQRARNHAETNLYHTIRQFRPDAKAIKKCWTEVIIHNQTLEDMLDGKK